MHLLRVVNQHTKNTSMLCHDIGNHCHICDFVGCYWQPVQHLRENPELPAAWHIGDRQRTSFTVPSSTRPACITCQASIRVETTTALVRSSLVTSCNLVPS